MADAMRLEGDATRGQRVASSRRLPSLRGEKSQVTIPPPWHSAIDDDGVSYETANLFIDTMEGEMMASPGDWIIKGVKGEFYPCKPDIFEATYEPA